MKNVLKIWVSNFQLKTNGKCVFYFQLEIVIEHGMSRDVFRREQATVLSAAPVSRGPRPRDGILRQDLQLRRTPDRLYQVTALILCFGVLLYTSLKINKEN